MRARIAVALAIAVVFASALYMYVDMQYGGETCFEGSSNSPTTIEYRC